MRTFLKEQGMSVRSDSALLLAIILAAFVPASARAELSYASMVGPAVRTSPLYDGSATQGVAVIPAVRYFGPGWFVRSTQGLMEGGGRIEIEPGLHAGAQMAYEPGREPGESDFLKTHHVPGLNRGASLGLQVEWDHQVGPMPFTLLTRVRKHANADRGTQADIRLSAGLYQSGPVSAGIFTQAIWADAKSAGSMYNISQQQAPITGLPAFHATSGWVSGSLGLIGSVELSHDWVAVGSFEGRRLTGNTNRSPLVEQTSNLYGAIGVAYRF
jgi:outer membrane protein